MQVLIEIQWNEKALVRSRYSYGRSDRQNSTVR